MLRFVSHIKEHITSIEFWRVLSFVAKRALSIEKLFTVLLAPIVCLYYVFHLIRAVLRIVNYFTKISNKNLGETLKLVFALFKVGIAITAFVIVIFGSPIPKILLSLFFAYNILKIIYSLVVLSSSLVFHFKISQSAVETHWMSAQYKDNIRKHSGLLGSYLMFILILSLFNAGASALVLSNPIVILLIAVAVISVITCAICLGRSLGKSQESTGKMEGKKKDSSWIGRALVLGGLTVSLLLCAGAVYLGFPLVSASLVVLNAQDALLSLYYYFFAESISEPLPAGLSPRNVLEVNKPQYFNYYYLSHSAVFLKRLEGLDKEIQANRLTNKIYGLKITLVQLWQWQWEKEQSLLKRESLRLHNVGLTSYFFQVYVWFFNHYATWKAKVREKKSRYLLNYLAWVLRDSRNSKEHLINLLIEAIISLNQDCKALEQQEISDDSSSSHSRINLDNTKLLEREFSEMLDDLEQQEMSMVSNESGLYVYRDNVETLEKELSEQPDVKNKTNETSVGFIDRDEIKSDAIIKNLFFTSQDAHLNPKVFQKELKGCQQSFFKKRGTTESVVRVLMAIEAQNVGLR